MVTSEKKTFGDCIDDIADQYIKLYDDMVADLVNGDYPFDKFGPEIMATSDIENTQWILERARKKVQEHIIQNPYLHKLEGGGSE